MGKGIDKPIKVIRRIEMRIAIYSNTLDNGGISKFVYNLQNAFGKCNIDSHIVTFRADTIYGDNITVLQCNNHLKRIRELSKFIKKENIEAVISNTWFEGFIARCAVIRSGKKIKVISVVHIRPNLWGFNEDDLLRRIFAKISLGLCNKVVAVSNELKDAMILEKWVKEDKITTIYNPVIFDEVNNHKIEFKDIENKELINIAVIGWIQPRKAQDIISKAFSEVNDRKYILNFIGGIEDENYYSNVLKIIEDNNLHDKVKFWGPRKDIFEILKDMDILISASRGEALPTVMIEALYSEVPMISSDCDYGPKEILDNGKYGLIFKVDDYKGLAKCFNKLVNDNNLYNNFLKKSKERSKLFTYDKCINSYLSILNE